MNVAPRDPSCAQRANAPPFIPNAVSSLLAVTMDHSRCRMPGSLLANTNWFVDSVRWARTPPPTADESMSPRAALSQPSNAREHAPVRALTKRTRWTPRSSTSCGRQLHAHLRLLRHVSRSWRYVPTSIFSDPDPVVYSRQGSRAHTVCSTFPVRVANLPAWSNL